MFVTSVSGSGAKATENVDQKLMLLSKTPEDIGLQAHKCLSDPLYI